MPISQILHKHTRRFDQVSHFIFVNFPSLNLQLSIGIRSIRLNTHYIALFKIPNRREQQIIYGEIGYGLNKDEFKTYFQKAIKEPFDFFFVDTRAKMKQLMYRKNFNYVLVEN